MKKITLDIQESLNEELKTCIEESGIIQAVLIRDGIRREINWIKSMQKNKINNKLTLTEKQYLEESLLNDEMVMGWYEEDVIKKIVWETDLNQRKYNYLLTLLFSGKYQDLIKRLNLCQKQDLSS